MQPVDEIPNYRTAYESHSPAVAEFVNIEKLAAASEEAKLTNGQLLEMQQAVTNFIMEVTRILSEND